MSVAALADIRTTLRQRLKAERQAVIADFRVHGKPEKLLRGLRQVVDGVLTDAWRQAGLPANTALADPAGQARRRCAAVPARATGAIAVGPGPGNRPLDPHGR
jgi:[protein-PII] uridylyltransferase